MLYSAFRQYTRIHRYTRKTDRLLNICYIVIYILGNLNEYVFIYIYTFFFVLWYFTTDIHIFEGTKS